VSEEQHFRRILRGQKLRTLVAFPVLLGYIFALGGWWKFRSLIRERKTIVTEISSGTFGVMVYQGPLAVEYLTHAYPDCDVVLMGDFNGANKFALKRLDSRSPANIHVHSSAIMRAILKWCRPGWLLNPAVTIWSRKEFPRFPRFAKPQVLTFQEVMESSEHLKSGAVGLSREYFGLTSLESTQCRTELEKIGLNLDNGFVCVNVRDDSWRMRNQSQSANDRNPGLRNSDAETYVPAILAVLGEGKAVVRVGRSAANSVKIEHSNFLDYAVSNIRDDLMDFFLGEFCDLAVSTGSGWDAIPRVMGCHVYISNYTNKVVTDIDRELWLDIFPPISIGFKRFIATKNDAVSLGINPHIASKLTNLSAESDGAEYICHDQNPTELTLQVLFALRLQQDSLYLQQLCKEQASFQSEWWVGAGGDQAGIPAWLPVLEPSYLVQHGQTLTVR